MNVNSDLSENFAYSREDTPFLIEKGQMSVYPNYTAMSHWHEDLELILVDEGVLHYNVNGNVNVIEPGDGIFVNTRQLHYAFVPEQKEVLYRCILFHPSLLSGNLFFERKFLLPVLYDETLSYRLLHRDDPTEGAILTACDALFAAKELEGGELLWMGRIYDIWHGLYLLRSPAKVSTGHHQQLQAIKEMIAFIGNHYKENITLQEISEAGSVSKTGCCVLFREYIRTSPIAYLNRFRLEHGAELLTGSDLTVTQIAFHVGFSGASYFAEMFRQQYGVSPREYRKQKMERNPESKENI